MFDRSWYNRAGVERVMGFCNRAEYLEFMRQAPELERMLVRSGIKPGQVLVLGVAQRAAHPLPDPPGRSRSGSGSSPRWTSQSLDKWDDYTEAKEAMFFYTDTADAPWTVVKSNDKKRARLEAIRHVLSRFDYEGKDRRPGRHARPADHRPGRPRRRLGRRRAAAVTLRR